MAGALLIARLKSGESLGDRVMKVNHAGEQGAVCIYRAQRWIASMIAPALVAELSANQAHEERHRAIFAAELARRGVRRCRSYWLCAIGGAVLGTITGLAGRRAIAATTVAVEQVVLRHLDAQRAALQMSDPRAVAAVDSIAREERDHHDGWARVLGTISWPDRLLMWVVSASTETVIWLGMRL
ncbi:MAG TPA: demethoxyubiquinone hydroxylase family protein [Reyranella sp.]|nr:demethoxyubiquinone hydroxylase family protein [Reyranella sp.]